MEFNLGKSPNKRFPYKTSTLFEKQIPGLWGAGGGDHPNNRAAEGIFPSVLYRPQERARKYPTNEMKGSRLSAVGLTAYSRPPTNEINVQAVGRVSRDPHLAAHHLELIMF